MGKRGKIPTEREQIVAWLRDEAKVMANASWRDAFIWAADRIEFTQWKKPAPPNEPQP